MIRIEDAKQAEWEYAKSKFPNMIELIDLEARNVFTKGVIISILKYIYRFNYYASRDSMINNDILSSKYP